MDFPAAVDRLRQRAPQRRRSKRGPLVVATWDRAQIYFLVASRRGEAVRALQRGSFARDTAGEILPQLAEQLRLLEVSASRLLLLLPRSDLEMASFEVPAADEDELPALIQMEVEQQVGESDREVIVDFLKPRPAKGASAGGGEASAEDERGERGSQASEAEGEPTEPASLRGIAYWMFRDVRDDWQQRASEAGFQLEAVAPRQLGPLAVLRTQRLLQAPLTVAMTCYADELECLFLQGSEVAILRSVRAGGRDGEALARQVETEILRTVSLAGLATEEEATSRLLLARGDASAIGGELAQERLATALSAQLTGAHGPVQSDVVDEDPVLWGAAHDQLLGRLDVNILAPKKPPVPPNPVYRWGAIGTLAIGALVIVGYLLLADVRALRNEVARQRTDVAEAEKVAAKLQEKADETRFVEQWLGDQVDWLEQLQLLSQQFPDGQTANARRMTAAAVVGGGRFDLSVQVKDPEAVATLEARLRGAGLTVSSGQINEQTRASEYPWQFETRIGFRETEEEPLDPAEAFLVGESPGPDEKEGT